jgi:post-segregation antitoxin (ccd killing protein)
MARLNVYVPDELAEEARDAGINVSQVTQEALRRSLAARRTSTWVARVRALPPLDVGHDEALAALDSARDEFGAPRA